eukprot:1985839-Prymnesium_polylepis.2
MSGRGEIGGDTGGHRGGNGAAGHELWLRTLHRRLQGNVPPTVWCAINHGVERTACSARSIAPPPAIPEVPEGWFAAHAERRPLKWWGWHLIRTATLLVRAPPSFARPHGRPHARAAWRAGRRRSN